MVRRSWVKLSHLTLGRAEHATQLRGAGGSLGRTKLSPQRKTGSTHIQQDLRSVGSVSHQFTSQDHTTAKDVPTRKESVPCVERKSLTLRIIGKHLCEAALSSTLNISNLNNETEDELLEKQEWICGQRDQGLRGFSVFIMKHSVFISSFNILNMEHVFMLLL